MKTLTLKAGTAVHVCGVLVELTADVAAIAFDQDAAELEQRLNPPQRPQGPRDFIGGPSGGPSGVATAVGPWGRSG